jgi:hypothetical protein
MNGVVKSRANWLGSLRPGFALVLLLAVVVTMALSSSAYAYVAPRAVSGTDTAFVANTELASTSMAFGLKATDAPSGCAQRTLVAAEDTGGIFSRLLNDETGTINFGSRYTEDQQALQEPVNEATNGGRTALSASDAQTVGQWADETGYPGARASAGDVASPSNWDANPVPHVHLPGVGRGGHIPVAPGTLPW